ncbi:MAG: DUF4386 domain-containing protein [Calditrichaceae bacterium]
METINENKLAGEKFLLQKAGRIAGITFLFNLIVPTLGYVFIQSKLFVQGNLSLTAENILDNEWLFRMGILLEVFLAVGLVTLGYSLYVLLKHLNPHLAIFAFIIKVVEASLMAVVTLISFFALQLLIHSAEISIINKNSIHVFAGFIFNQHSILNAALIFIYAILSIIHPRTNLMMLTLPSFLFELICGSWLLLKGISSKNLNQ